LFLKAFPGLSRAADKILLFKAGLSTENADVDEFVLVARVFSQRLGDDYDETFATVARHETIPTLLSIAARFNCWIDLVNHKPDYPQLILVPQAGRLEKGVISRVVMQVEEATSRTAVKCVLNELDAQYAETHRAQVPLEDPLPDKYALEAALQEWRSLAEEVSMTRIVAATFLDKKEANDASQQKSPLKKNSPPQSQLEKLNDLTLPKCVNRREEVSSITHLLYQRSCLSSPALKAIEGVTDVVESLVVLNSCADDGAAELTRLHDELNGHILELKALGENANSGLSVFHPLLLIIKKKLRSGTVNDCKGFVTDKMDDEITLDEFLAYVFDQTRIRESDNATRTKATLKKDKPVYEKREKYEIRFRTAAVLPLSEVPDAMDLLGKDATGSLAALFEYFRGEWMTLNKLALWNVYKLLRAAPFIDRRAGGIENVDSASDIRMRYQGCYFNFCQLVLRRWQILDCAFLLLAEVPDAVDLLCRDVAGSLAALFQYHVELDIMWNIIFYKLLRLLIDEQGSTETLIQQVTSGRVAVNDLRVKNNKYDEVQLRITALSAEYDGGTRTME
ncbi:hypothetical protein T05_11669, partial [Trichinella murrelli]